MDTLAKSLHPLEVKVLLAFSTGAVISAGTLEKQLSFNIGQANQALSWLQGKGAVVEHARTQATQFELTELGLDQAAHGTPEERLFNWVKLNGPANLPEIARAIGIEARDLGSAFGLLSKSGAAAMDADKKVNLKTADIPLAFLETRALIQKAMRAEGQILVESLLSAHEKQLLEPISKKRGAGNAAFRIAERELVEFMVTPQAGELAAAARAAGITGEEVNSLTPAMLKDGSWKSKTFRPFNISIPPARIIPGRRNAYCEFLDEVKDKLVGFGFEEFDGPLVETEFWNSDALFMPQFHSARDIHDVYYLKNTLGADGAGPGALANNGFAYAQQIEPRFLDKVAAAHENGANTGSRGWNYSFDREFTRRLILRSQGTVMSAKTLHQARIPGKYFGILRCFRYDQVDATHLSDFYQHGGIVLGDDVNLKNLLGLLKMFATELAGATEVKYVPGYFPFTEPSVEVHIKHPVLGWFELGGAGIFRPEVTIPMGINVPVLAWGLGIDRMALMSLGLSDLRELFSSNIEQVRLRKRA